MVLDGTARLTEGGVGKAQVPQVCALGSPVLQGDGGEAEALKRLAAGSPRVRFLGQLDPVRLRTAYERATAVIFPSLTYETFGQVIVEAFSMRTPVIVRDLGPLPELIADSDGGLVFGNDSELGAAIDRLANDSALRNRLGTNGHRTYCSRWAADVYVDAYLGMIEDIRARQGAPIQ